MPSKKRRSKSKNSSPPNSPPPARDEPTQNPNPNLNSKNPKKPKPSSPDRAPSKSFSSDPSPSKRSSKNPKPPAMPAKDPSLSAAADHDPDPSASPRKNQRKRKAPEISDEPSLAVSPSSGKAAAAALFQRRWTDDDVLTLLKAVVDFRSETGSIPTGSTMAPFFDSVKPSLPNQFTQDQVYNKLRHLRQKYFHSSSNGPQDTPFIKLSADAWGEDAKKANDINVDVVKKGDAAGEEDKEPEEDDDLPKTCPRLIKEISEYWKDNDLPEELLKMAMTLVDSAKAKALETKWHRHHAAELKLQAKRFELSKETFVVLASAQGTGS